MTIRAVLFDVGGPIDTEEISERLIDRDIRLAVGTAGVRVTDEALQRASDEAVASFAPDAYRAIIWSLAVRNEAVARAAYARFASEEARAARRTERGGIELRPGIVDVLRALQKDHLLLGLAANQPASIINDLDRAGLAELFQHREVSGHHGYGKPDVRLFLRACDDLGVGPDQCVMVGDRVDNDIVPARTLGMATVLLRTGRHRAQQPRSWEEQPDTVAFNTPEMLAAIRLLVGARASASPFARR